MVDSDLMDCSLCDDKPLRFYPKGKCPKFKWRNCHRRTGEVLEIR